MTIFAFLAFRNIKQLHAHVQPILNINDRNSRIILIHRRDREFIF